MRKPTDYKVTACTIEMIPETYKDKLSICLDSERDYDTNEKLIRLILFMIADSWGSSDSSTYIDMLTLDILTTIVCNGDQEHCTMQAENCRYKLKQTDGCKDNHDINRLKLSMIGEELSNRKDYGYADVGKNWVGLLDSLGHEQFSHVIDNATDATYSLWQDHIKKRSKASARRRNNYYSMNQDNIFTYDELLALYTRDYGSENGRAKNAVSRILRKWPNCFELYTYDDVQAEISAIKTALKTFIGQ